MLVVPRYILIILSLALLALTFVSYDAAYGMLAGFSLIAVILVVRDGTAWYQRVFYPVLMLALVYVASLHPAALVTVVVVFFVFSLFVTDKKTQQRTETKEIER